MQSDSPLPIMFFLEQIPRSISPDQLDLFVPVSCPLLYFLQKLLLTFNSYIFYILFNVIIHICDYPEKQVSIALYVNMVKQASIIVVIGSKFVKDLIKAIKKDKSWTHAE